MDYGNTSGPSGDSAPVRAVLCSNALQQKLPPGIQHLRRIERLNMIHQIPELGVVVIGNQIGRVGLLTLTTWRPTEKGRRKLSRVPDVKVHAGFKISAILPRQSQEGRNMRPETPLLGMAVSPIQGHGTTNAGLRRYRLLMTYYDHTILSYEILRESPGGQLLIV